MKVNEDLRTILPKQTIEQNGTQNRSKIFSQMVEKHESKLHEEQWKQLLNELEEAGERLSKSRNMYDLSKFKRLVKRLIRETIEFGMGVKESKSWDFYGNRRNLKIVSQIDQKLVELTEEILNKEKDAVNILGKIGEIKGLIVNLYT
ncbi:MAG: DUF327 domain-containing protein [Bacillaceae bacterium]|uniref:YaaR family protein n=1 Tax=Aeribacillus TaxID=1055323 RepID=UPI000E38C562|nr:YaaR family protein [Aeribacillus composti]MED0716341.1 YaaR family protein [Aeribacillus composti]MED0744854.1 YaaR family protein [Aeribacillus composti]REJ15220.1 MAG: DUF327 domain-containing protein [Bacillaceae bacterium]